MPIKISSIKNQKYKHFDILFKKFQKSKNIFDPS